MLVRFRSCFPLGSFLTRIVILWVAHQQPSQGSWLHLVAFQTISNYMLINQAVVTFCHLSCIRWKKVKCTLVQALRLCTGVMAHRESRGIALPFHDHGTRRGWGVSVMPRPLFTPRKTLVPIVQEAGWAPGPVDRCGKSRPTHSQSLYRLSYPVNVCNCIHIPKLAAGHVLQSAAMSLPEYTCIPR